MGTRRILVVDDSRTVRRVVERALVSAGFDVDVAVDGRDALEQAQARVPDLVLTDFVMPHMNGLRLVQSLRAIANLESVPVVLMSAKADKIGESFLAQTGALDAITKPFSPEALLAVATHALARAEEAQTLPPPPPPPDPQAAERIETTSVGQRPTLDPARANAASRIMERFAELYVVTRGEALGVDREAVLARVKERIEPEVMLAWVSELASLVPDLHGDRALEGALEHVPVGDVLELLRLQRQTGTLEIESDGDLVSIGISQGAVDLAIARPSRPEFRIGRYVVEMGLIEADELEHILEVRTGARQLLGTYLMKLGYLRPEDLTRALTQQTSELVYEALRWRTGRYRFFRLATRPEAAAARLGVPVSAILMEGLRRVDEWRLVEEQIRSFDEVFRPDSDAIARFDLDQLAREDRAVLAAVDGQRSVRSIVETTRMGSFEVGKILFQLLTSRLVRR